MACPNHPHPRNMGVSRSLELVFRPCPWLEGCQADGGTVEHPVIAACIAAMPGVSGRDHFLLSGPSPAAVAPEGLQGRRRRADPARPPEGPASLAPPTPCTRLSSLCSRQPGPGETEAVARLAVASPAVRFNPSCGLSSCPTSLNALGSAARVPGVSAPCLVPRLVSLRRASAPAHTELAPGERALHAGRVLLARAGLCAQPRAGASPRRTHLVPLGAVLTATVANPPPEPSDPG